MDTCPNFTGRDAIIETSITTLTKSAVCLVGTPGVGISTVAAQIQAALTSRDIVKRTAILHLNELSDWSDIVYALGQQLSVTLPGDEAGVAQDIREGASLCVWIDDADLHPNLTKRTLAAFSSARWVLTSRAPVQGTTKVSVPPLERDLMDQLFPKAVPAALDSGCPGLALISTEFTPQTWENAKDHIPQALKSAIRLPLGGADYPSLRRLIPIREGVPHPSRTLREFLEPEHLEKDGYANWFDENQAAITEGALGIWSSNALPQCLLRKLARTPSNPNQAAWAASCAGRQWIRRFQSANALELIRSVFRTPSIPPKALGILRFTEGHAHLASGSTVRAQKAFEAGFSLLVENTEIQTLLSIQCVQEWIVRGDIERAHAWLGLLDQNNQAESLRLSAGLSRQAGEWLGATALLDAADKAWAPNTAPVPVQACANIERARIHLAKGSLLEAAKLLQGVTNDPESSTQIHASAHFHMAEISLKRGSPDVTQWLNSAQKLFQTGGSYRGLCECFRLKGDIAALTGRPYDAITAWQDAARLCARTSDTRAIKPILERLVTLEREGGPGPHVDTHESHLDLLDAIARK